MRKSVMAFLCLLAFACEQKPVTPVKSVTRVRPSDVSNAKVNEVITPAPRYVERSMLGPEVGPNGWVTKESDKFTQGQPIYFTLVIRESPAGLQTSAVWMGMDKMPLRTERKEMNGRKAATFGFVDPKLKPGHYKVVGYWGGNFAAEREFEVVAKAKRKKG